ncbi:MAG: efflux RND transporter permease subunit [Acidobacteria bacterium]|nr:efflux RND transporter permease subunit [Acidobacteriota bacterium]MBI3656006.1 efflux RND transporter permease subunit [Acidobacteriota bacterium]
MIQKLVDFALRNKFIVLGMGILLLIWGAVSFHTLPVEAYPDVADTYVQVITQWPGRAAEEVEQQVTIPIEIQMKGVGQLTHLRSVSLFGLSVVTMIFDDEANNLLIRAQVLEKLSQVNLPANLNPQLGPDFSPVGQLYFYTLRSTNPLYDLMELKSLQDWDVRKHLKSVRNVVDVSIFGGATQEYQVQVDPNKLIAYGLSLGQLEQALAANNVNAGGSFIERGEQAFNIRAIGLMTNTDDIGATVLKTQSGTPIRVRDVAVVTQGPKIRLGQIGKTIHREDSRVIDNNDVVEGIVLMRKGAEPEATLKAIHAKVKELNDHLLPPGVKIVPHLDRSDLVGHTTKTVLKNLTEGILLVVIVLFLFLGNLRSALIVALTIPFSLLFASILLDLRHIPANLLSLGALDFGMVVDGSVVMVENILRLVTRKEDTKRTLAQKISRAAHQVQRPVFYGIIIIITAYLPIFTLQRVEGRLFRPMSWTVAFALLGALVFALVLAPILASFLFRENMREWRNPVLAFVSKQYMRQLKWCIHHRWVTIGTSLALLVGALFLAFGGFVGSEFLPHLDEGAIWARGTLASSTGPSAAGHIVRQARLVFAGFPEVIQVVSQMGRPDDGTDATGFFNTEYFVDLKPHDQWRGEFRTKEDLIAAMDKELQKIPGVLWNFSQPIADNMEEAVSGVKGQLAVKLIGADLKQLEAKAEEIAGAMRTIPGVTDLGVFRVVGQPNVNVIVDRGKADRFGLNVADVQDAIEAAVGGKAVGQILQGERRFDLVVRYQEPYRRTPEDIADIRILAPSGERVALGQLSTITVEDGASMIYRENNARYIAIKYSVRGRDLGSTVDEAIQAVEQKVKLPEGYRLDWTGEYESQKRANQRLAVIVPLTILLIFMILYSAFNSFKWALLTMVNIAIAPIGGILALWLTGTHFSVSSGVGMLALFGVSVQIGVIMVEYINQLRARGHSILEATVQGAVLRLRPILMTMLVATLGLLPAALSHGIGSDSQRPFAIVIVGGLLVDLVMSIVLLPTLYVWWASPDDPLPPGELSDTQTTTPELEQSTVPS